MSAYTLIRSNNFMTAVAIFMVITGSLGENQLGRHEERGGEEPMYVLS